MSEQIFQIAEAVARGIDVIENRGRFLIWMKQPNVAFGLKNDNIILNPDDHDLPD